MIMGPETLVLGDCQISERAVIDPFTIIGYRGVEKEIKLHQRDLLTVVKDEAHIGAFCLIYGGAKIGNGASIDPYVRVGRNTYLGDRVAVMYGSRVHDDVVIGDDSIIAGNVSNRVKIGKRVRHHGKMAHRYNQPHGGWHAVDEPSLVIEDDSVIGSGSLLVGDIRIGRNSYIAAGEIVRRNVPEFSIFYGGRVIAAEDWRGTLSESGFWRNRP
jgi:UDP-3-O-[3-hydroxymyristoyl] glucosamine N-acyltransferase